MLRRTILAASRNDRVKALVAGAPVSRDVVARFVAGEELDDAVRAAMALEKQGLAVTLDRLGEDVLDAEQAMTTVRDYCAVLGQLAAEGLTQDGRCEVSVKLTAVGQAIDEAMALDGARTICAAARDAGTTVTFDMEDHTTTDSTLGIVRALREDFPSTGAVLQAYLRRTEGDCRDLAGAGSRVRLCKGAYKEPESVAFQTSTEVDRSYVRCMRVLLAGEGYPMLATHDPRLIGLVPSLAGDRTPDSWEFQMLYGIRPKEQRRLVEEGKTMRVYVPYGTEWYGYLMRRLAEKPANVSLFLRALVDTS